MQTKVLPVVTLEQETCRTDLCGLSRVSDLYGAGVALRGFRFYEDLPHSLQAPSKKQLSAVIAALKPGDRLRPVP